MTDSVISLKSVQTTKIQYPYSTLGPSRADWRMAITEESQLSWDLKGQTWQKKWLHVKMPLFGLQILGIRA